MRIALYTSVLNQTVPVIKCLSVTPHRLSALFSVGNIQSNCNKHTCLQSRSATVFSAILLCCELCQAVQVHKRYTDPLQLTVTVLISLNTQSFQIIHTSSLDQMC